MKNIRLLRLISGEDIIASYSRFSDTQVLVENPVRIVVIPSQVGEKVVLVKWMPFTSDEKILIDKSSVIAIMTPLGELTNQYEKINSKVIQPTSPGLLLPTGGFPKG